MSYLTRLIMRAQATETTIRPRLPSRFEAPQEATPGDGWAGAPAATALAASSPAHLATPPSAARAHMAGFVAAGDAARPDYASRDLVGAADPGKGRKTPGEEVRHPPSQPARRDASGHDAEPAPHQRPAQGSPRPGPGGSGAPRGSEEAAKAGRPAAPAEDAALMLPIASLGPLTPDRIAIAGQPAPGAAPDRSVVAASVRSSAPTLGTTRQPPTGTTMAPTVQVTIGRVDVRADLTPTPATKRMPATQSRRAGSLSDYLKGRGRA